MIKTYKNIKTQIKKIAYTSIISGLIIAALGIGVFAQEGTIEEKVNKDVSNPANIGYAIKEEQKSLEDISNEINQNVQEKRENAFKIGQWEGYTQTIEGNVYYFVEGLDCPFLKYEIKSDSIPTFAASANYLIKQGLEGIVSAIGYNKDDIKFYRASRELFYHESKEQKKDEKDVYTILVKANIENTE